MKAKEYVDSVDWEFYLERVQTILQSTIFSWAHTSMLKNATGFSFQHQLTIVEGKVSRFYRSATEMKEARKHYQKMAQDEELILSWLEEERKTHDLATQEYDGLPEAFEACKKIFLWNTLIPRLILMSLDENHKVFKRFASIRGGSLYPTFFQEKILPLLKTFAQKYNVPVNLATRLTDEEILSGSLPSSSELAQRECCQYFFRDGNQFLSDVAVIREHVSEAKKYIESVNWVFYLERIRPVLLTSIMTWNYGPDLEEQTGFRFAHQLIRRDGDRELLHLAPGEMAAADEHFGKLLTDEDPRILEWFAREREIRDKVQTGVSFENIHDMVVFFRQVTLYNTILPYRLFSALQPSHREEYKERLEQIRSTSLYPSFYKEVVLPTLEASAGDFNIPTELIVHCTDQEILAGSIPSPDELEMRKQCYFFLRGEKITFYYGRVVQLEGVTAERNTFSGTVAYAAELVEGTIRIINSVDEVQKMSQGDVMLSINSNPTLMPAIKKAAALVTNEGGALCHAAVVSRELKIPCIIGTKDATRVFKDGERVCVDTKKGTITKL